ncbi:MAG: hypothetical protein FJW20_06420 [Acidimicrobiia bacterium]|nr:hypothetical protein [Acidimicrobiia bacterium]
MFTWICPKCGREVPPSYSECPDCAAKEQPAAAAPSEPQPERPAQAAAPPPEQAQPAPPPQAAPPQPPVQYVYVQRKQPAWLVTLAVALGLVAIGAGAYYFLPSVRATRSTSAEPEVKMETPAEQAKSAPSGSANLARHLEVVGIRILEENRRPMVRFLVVNHSNADFPDLNAVVTLRSTKAAADSAPISTIDLKLSALAANASVEIAAPLKTGLRAYEMPDWQFLRADIQLR